MSRRPSNPITHIHNTSPQHQQTHTHHTMADRQSTYTVSVFPSDADGDRQDAAPTRIQKALAEFVMDFHLDNVFIYRCIQQITRP